ncbi:MAG: HD domain-containing protein [Candidatus Poribacteria bacterium]|nr:HD domain-containing protein [Candidatus Poribacteria bacterium]
MKESMTEKGNCKNSIEEAIEVAAQAHNGQFRKGTSTPYITHPYAVGLLLMEVGCSETLIIAGILHDTVEDTELTLDTIRKDFGDTVADIVDGCSENKSLRWRERKTERIEALKTASTEICIVTCADKLHNLRTVISEYDNIGEAVWDRFHGGLEAQEWYYRSVLDSLRTQKESKIKDSNSGVVQKQFNFIFEQLQQVVMYIFEGQ